MTKRFEIGEYGDIVINPLPSGLFQARGRYRGPDGVVREKKASAPTERLAKMVWIKEVQLECASATGGSDDLSRKSTVEELAEQWINRKIKEGKRPQSIANYRSNLRSQVLPRSRAWRVEEMTTPRIEKLLDDIHEAGLSTNQARKVLSNMSKLAVQLGLLASNPVRDVTYRQKTDVEKAEAEVRPFTSAYDVEAVFALIGKWMERMQAKSGPNPTNDMRDFCLFLAGTGVRPGEGLCLRWTDFNLLADKPYVDIEATLVFLEGRGNFRQELPKTDAGVRRLFLPSLVVAMLLRRQTEQGHNPLNAVFPARNGAWPSQTKYGLRLREVIEGTDYDWVVFKTFRRTVATNIKRKYGSQAAADQLGHKDTSVVDRYYTPAEHMGPDAVDLINASVLGALGMTP